MSFKGREHFRKGHPPANSGVVEVIQDDAFTHDITHTIWLFPEIGVFLPKWMVKRMEKPIKIRMIWGENPLFSETAIYLHLTQAITTFQDS